MFVPSDINTYVKFINGEDIDKSIKSGTKQKFNKRDKLHSMPEHSPRPMT